MKMHMKRLGLLLMMMLFFLAISQVSALAQGVIDLPETGQTTCYNSAGAVIACLDTGQDGDWLAGVPWPSPRFTDNGNGTVTDNLTGLIWLKNANCFGLRTWATALTDANTLNSGECGLTDGSVEGDWRLPNVNELESLINAEESNTATWLNTQGFTTVQSDVYWSSSTYADGTAGAWYVAMWDGVVFADGKTVSYYVWPVRAATSPPAELWKTGQTTSYAAGDDGALERGVAWPSPRFTDNGNGTVTDNLTGLIWLKNANCFGVKVWATALNDANTLNSGECGLTDGSVEGDWRLPNRKELRSLVDYSRWNPALIAGHPFTTVQSFYYWSSSTYAIITDYAWVVYMWVGNVVAGHKTSSYYVWPVRAGTLGNSDISVTKTDSPDPVVVGNNITYTITITNNGPDPATGVTLTDTLPAGTTFVSAVSTQGSCAEAGGVVTCGIGNMANGAVVTVTIVVIANAAGAITNTAAVTSTSIDPNLANNTATATTTVQVQAAACLRTTPIPTGPTAWGPFPPGLLMSYDPAVLRPFGLEETGGMLTGWLWLPCWWNGNVDIYLVVHQSPYGQLIMNNFHQWLPYPANLVPWKANTADDVYAQLFSYLKSNILAGSYQLDVIVVPSGTPAAAIPGIVGGTATTPYYKWRFAKTLP